MYKKVKKAIIPAAGMGTRLLPITKSIPKEMIPIIDKPIIQYIVEEAIESGIEEILIIVSSSKNTILDYFDYNYELESRLEQKNKFNESALSKKIADMVQIQYLRQKEPLGLGHAIKIAKNFINDEPFAVLLGDDIVINNSNQLPALKQCINEFNIYNSSIIGVQKVNKNDLNKYGIINIDKKVNNDLFLLKDLIEKPNIESAPSEYAILGRYVFTPNIINEIEKINFDSNNEIQLTSAISNLAKIQTVYAKCFDGSRYDAGSKLGIVKAIIDIGLNHNEIKDDLKKYLNKILI